MSAEHRFRGPERRGGGCDGPRPPGQGCDPYVVETGRVVPLTHRAGKLLVSASLASAGGVRVFGGKAPPLYRVAIGRVRVQGRQEVFDPDPRLAVAPAKDSVQAYYRRQLDALARYPIDAAPASQRAEVEAAVLVNTALLSLKLRERARAQDASARLRRRLETREGAAIARRLKLDVTLPNLERILRGEWLLDDPC